MLTYCKKCIMPTTRPEQVFEDGISCEVDCANVAGSKVAALGIASLFHFTGVTPNDCKNELARCDIPVRLK